MRNSSLCFFYIIKPFTAVVQTVTIFIIMLGLILLVMGCNNNSASNPEDDLKKPNSAKNNISYGAVSVNKSSSFLFLSDIHLDVTVKNTVYDHNHKDDTGLDIWNALIAKLHLILAAPDAPDFIVYTGDLPAHYGLHYLDTNNRLGHNNNMRAVLDSLRLLSDKYNKPLFYVPGNNDALAGDYYSFADESNETPLILSPDKNNPYPAININQTGSASPCMVSNPHPAMGYYAARPVDGLRLLALNTVMLNRSFKIVDSKTLNQKAYIDTLFTWMALQLADAQIKNEKVYIAMHIPPGADVISGNPMWIKTKDDWQTRFLQIVEQYDTTIAGMLYGHTHMDELRLLYSTGPAKRVTELAVSSPGITPKYGHHPGFKTVQYHPISKELMDFTTYFTMLPITKSGWMDSTYTFRSAFNVKTNISMYDVVKNMGEDTFFNYLRTIYNVHKGIAGYNITAGIKVE